MEHWGEHGGTLVHTSTHFGSPPACAAALATIAALRTGDLLAEVAAKGEALLRELEQGGVNARGRGLMVGVVAGKDAAAALALARRLLAKGYIVLTGGAAGNVLTLSPPLTIAPALLSAFASALID
jgi:4-aminobutyrate aminotransferase-like enzyme